MGSIRSVVYFYLTVTSCIYLSLFSAAAIFLSLVTFFFKCCSFLAHLAKDHVSFCHDLASVIRPSVVRRKLSHLNLLL